MKRPIIFIVSALLAVTSVAALAGCGSKDNKSSVTESTVQSAADTTQGGEDSAAPEGALTDADAVFTYNGVSVELNSDADAAVSELGEANDVSSQMSCHGEGEDKTYTYDEFVLNTYPLDGQDRVLEIVVNSDTVATTKGIKIGDTAEQVKAAYGAGYREIGTYYAYDAGDKKSIQFLMEDGKVKEISYYYDV